MRPDYSLYVITDADLLGERSLAECVGAAISGGATIVQIRRKGGTDRAFYEEALALKCLLDREHVPLIVNDRIDIALALGAAGVHLGQDDLSCREARRVLGGEVLIGVSAATVNEVREAESQGADYIGVGPVFATATKADAGPALGAAVVGEICRNSRLPVVAIGGISSVNVGELRGVGLAGVAVVSAIMCAADPEAEAREIRRRFLGEGV